MSGHLPSAPDGGVSRRGVEIVTAAAIAAVGAVALWDSRRIGAGWGADGPQSGYFPFWIALCLLGVALAILVEALRGSRPDEAFLTRQQLRLVLSVLLPTVVYVAMIAPLGIYLPSALLVTWFMARLGGYAWTTGLAVGAGVAAACFVTFERWFLVPLPKGPVEAWLGF